MKYSAAQLHKPKQNDNGRKMGAEHGRRVKTVCRVAEYQGTCQKVLNRSALVRYAEKEQITGSEIALLGGISSSSSSSSPSPSPSLSYAPVVYSRSRSRSSSQSSFKAILVLLAVPAIGMLLQSRFLRGALEVLEADFAFDRLGCRVLPISYMQVSWPYYSHLSLLPTLTLKEGRRLRLSAANPWWKCPLRCAHAFAVLLLRCPCWLLFRGMWDLL